MLDDTKTYERLDPLEASYGVEHLSLQAKQAFFSASAVAVPLTYKRVSQVLVLGSGASAFAGHVVHSVFSQTLSVPISVLSGDMLPKWVGANTLVIAVSFSGETVETIAAVKAALKARAKVCVISGGGKLASLAKKDKLPAYVFSADDLARSPQFAMGFTLFGVLGLLKSAGLLRVSQKDVQSAIAAMVDVADSCALLTPLETNPAKIVASALKESAVFILGAEHLIGLAHTFAGHVREVAGQFAMSADVPNALHTLPDGLRIPFEKQGAHALMLRSKLYTSANKDRMERLATALEEQGVEVIDYETRGKTVLEEAAEVMQFGLFVSYYLAMLNGVRPEEAAVATKLKG